MKRLSRCSVCRRRDCCCLPTGDYFLPLFRAVAEGTKRDVHKIGTSLHRALERKKRELLRDRAIIEELLERYGHER